MANVTIRKATFEDLPGILEIYNEPVFTTTATYADEPRTMEYRVQWFQDQEQRGLPVFVALTESDRVVGWSALKQPQDRVGYRFTAESSIYVSAHERGQGVGRLLMLPLIESAKAKGLHALLAAIDAENEGCLHLHSTFGYEKVGCFRQVGCKFGRWLDIVYMERLF